MNLRWLVFDEAGELAGFRYQSMATNFVVNLSYPSGCIVIVDATTGEVTNSYLNGEWED